MARYRGPAAFQFGQVVGDFLPFLAQRALCLPEFPQGAGLAGADPVEGGGTLEIGVGVGGEQQGEGRIDSARAVLGAGDRTERTAHPVDAVLAARGPVL